MTCNSHRAFHIVYIQLLFSRHPPSCPSTLTQTRTTRPGHSVKTFALQAQSCLSRISTTAPSHPVQSRFQPPYRTNTTIVSQLSTLGYVPSTDMPPNWSASTSRQLLSILTEPGASMVEPRLSSGCQLDWPLVIGSSLGSAGSLRHGIEEGRVEGRVGSGSSGLAPFCPVPLAVKGSLRLPLCSDLVSLALYGACSSSPDCAILATPSMRDIIFHTQWCAGLAMVAVQWPGFTCALADTTCRFAVD